MKAKKDSINWYVKIRPVYKRLSVKVENILVELFDIENIPYHMVTSRTKDIDSFIKKISGDKYDNPIEQIQDLAGIRIITYVEDEIQRVCDIIEKTLEIDWENSSDKSNALGIDKVGYKSVHYVASLKQDRLDLPEYQQFKGCCFELQIRTILQHAWAEIEHDRNYKYSGKLPDEISRRFKLLAGSLEMADREFNNISKEIDVISENVEKATKKGKLNIELNSTSLSQFLKTKLKEAYRQGFNFIPNSNAKLLKEMNDFGLSTLEDFDQIIKSDFEEVLINKENIGSHNTEMGLVRMIMIIHNVDQYFKKAFKGGFSVWTQGGHGGELLKHYGINWEKDVFEKYDIPFE